LIQKEKEKKPALARWSVALPALRTGSPAPYTAHFPPAAARGPMAFGLRLVRHFFLSFFQHWPQSDTAAELRPHSSSTLVSKAVTDSAGKVHRSLSYRY
jgi:hypothetical protein